MHDYFIGGLITIIVFIQIAVTIRTSKKIALFRAIIPKENSFEIVKVLIPEDQIKTIKVEDILNNISFYENYTNEIEPTDDYYTAIANNSEDFQESNNIEHEEIVEELLPFQGLLPLNEDIDLDSEESCGNELLIWIAKGNKEKKVPVRLLVHYESLGWQKLHEEKYGS
jgi:hypothetical protein